tara:strand:+ start:194 stop:1180 length:987 start_codon:yes stop_codon:yes gene_type:complete
LNYNFKNIILIVVFINFILTSCIKELPIEVHSEGNINLVQIEMGGDYENQLFYSLIRNDVVNQNLETEWDIAFECNIEGSHIILNSATSGAVYKTNVFDFDSINSLNGNENWNYDAPNGNLDSTAFGDYSNGNLYILNRGISVSQGGNNLGYKKIIIKSISSNQYEIRYADLNGDNDTTLIINKDTNFTFLAFSFNKHKIVDIFPHKQNWDILFTAYTHVFNDFTPPLPYRVSGVILNRENTSVALDTTNDFSNIDYDLATLYEFNYEIDAIGYDWKNYSFSTSSYTVDSYKTFIIKTNIGFYYKLRFIDFYNDNGDKGSPKFELQQL